MIWDTVNVLIISWAGKVAWKLAGKILNVLEMYQVGKCWVHCPFPCDVLVMYQLSTPPLAPCVYWGRLGPYRSYLDHPARGLQYFSDDHDLSHLFSGQTQLFAGQVPNLQSLVTSALKSWPPGMLVHLRVLNLWDCDNRLSLGSLLDSLRCTPKLEEISIVSPNPPMYDCPPGEVVDLSHLKDITVRNPDFYSIVGHFAVPNARTVAVYSVYTRGASGTQVGPAFRSPNPFVGFSSMPTPLLSRAIVMASFEVQVFLSDCTFTISIVTEKKTSLYISLEWTGSADIGERMEYIRSSITALARMDFRPGATLQVRTNGCTIDHSPLLRLNAIEYFSIECEDISKILEVLSCRRVPLLPNLKSLFVPEVELDKKAIESLLDFLQSRRGLVVVFYIANREDLVRMLGDYCVVVGEPISSRTTLPPRATQISLTERMTQIPNLDEVPWPSADVCLKD